MQGPNLCPWRNYRDGITRLEFALLWEFWKQKSLRFPSILYVTGAINSSTFEEITVQMAQMEYEDSREASLQFSNIS